MSKSKPPINDEESALFRQTVKGSIPLKAKTRIPKVPSPTTRRPSVIKARQVPEFSPISDIPSEQMLAGADIMHFARSGLQTRLLQRFQRGQLPLQARLDLHRFTVAEALEATEAFLQQCQLKQVRFVLIIHGKGHLSNQNKPLIKNALYRWLREQPTVLAFHSAQPRHGGSGAVYVLLKI